MKMYKITLDIPNMHCRTCADRAIKRIGKAIHVPAMQANLLCHTLIILSPRFVKKNVFARALNNTGYSLRGMSTQKIRSRM